MHAVSQALAVAPTHVQESSPTGLLVSRVCRQLKGDVWKSRMEAVAWSIIPLAALVLSVTAPYLTSFFEWPLIAVIGVDVGFALTAYFTQGLFKKAVQCWNKAVRTNSHMHALQSKAQERVDGRFLQEQIPYFTPRQMKVLYLQLSTALQRECWKWMGKEQVALLLPLLSTRDKVELLAHFQTFVSENEDELIADPVERWRLAGATRLMLKSDQHPEVIVNGSSFREQAKRVLASIAGWERRLNIIRREREERQIPQSLKALQQALGLVDENTLVDTLNRSGLSLKRLKQVRLLDPGVLQRERVKDVESLKKVMVYRGLEALLEGDGVEQWLENRGYFLSDLSSLNLEALFTRAACETLDAYLFCGKKEAKVKAHLHYYGLSLETVINEALCEGTLIPVKWREGVTQFKELLIERALSRLLKVDSPRQVLEQRGVVWNGPIQALSFDDFLNFAAGFDQQAMLQADQGV